MDCVRKSPDSLPAKQCLPVGHKAGALFPTILFTGFALALITLSASFGFGDDPEVEILLLAPSACTDWQTRAKSQDSARDRLSKSPLIREAERFALFLNPPQAAKAMVPTHRPSASTSRTRTASAPNPALRPRESTAKFTLHATSYYASSPEESMALIDEPGKGLHWVRQGTQVGYIVIHEIKRGMIFLRDGNRVQEMRVEAVKTPGPTPVPQPPSAAQYAKHMPGLPAPPINSTGTSTRATGAARRDMVPLKSRPKRPGRGR